MKTWDALFWQCEDLAALQANLLCADEPWVRTQLLQQFVALKTYRNAEEWNRLVWVLRLVRDEMVSTILRVEMAEKMLLNAALI